MLGLAPVPPPASSNTLQKNLTLPYIIRLVLMHQWVIQMQLRVIILRSSRVDWCCVVGPGGWPMHCDGARHFIWTGDNALLLEVTGIVSEWICGNLFCKSNPSYAVYTTMLVYSASAPIVRLKLKCVISVIVSYMNCAKSNPVWINCVKIHFNALVSELIVTHPGCIKASFCFLCVCFISFAFIDIFTIFHFQSYAYPLGEKHQIQTYHIKCICFEFPWRTPNHCSLETHRWTNLNSSHWISKTTKSGQTDLHLGHAIITYWEIFQLQCWE